MDGIYERYEYIRYPGTWAKELEVLKYWDNMPDNVTVDIDCTVSALNVSHIPDFVRWKMDQGFKKLNKTRFGGTIGMHLLWTPNFLGINNLNDEIKAKASNDIAQLRMELGTTVTNRYKKFDALLNALDKPATNITVLVEYLDKMDKIRGTSWQDTFPELISLRKS